jgi:UDP-GlcNAc:undecaprenyl-phosphate GlcNAc-1-phosphate transferase
MISTDLTPYEIMSLVFIGGLLIFKIINPYMIKIAYFTEILDRPDGILKRHSKTIPYLGGITIFITIWITFLTVTNLLNIKLDKVFNYIFIFNLIILMVGTIDDKIKLSWSLRLALQFVISIFTIYYLNIENSNDSYLNFIIYTFFLVGIINSANLIDISDGLSTTLALTSLLTLLILSTLGDQFNLSILIISMIAAYISYLKINWHPAKVYMGDGGSNSLGYMIGTLSILLTQTETFEISIVKNILIFYLPIFDTILIILLRLSKGKNPFKGSPDHFAVRMRLNGYSAPKIVYLAVIISAIIQFVVVITDIYLYKYKIQIHSTILLLMIILGLIVIKKFPLKVE